MHHVSLLPHQISALTASPEAQLLLWLIAGTLVGAVLSFLAVLIPETLERETHRAEALDSGTLNQILREFLRTRRLQALAFALVSASWAGLTWSHFDGAPLPTLAWSMFGWIVALTAAIDAETFWLPDVLTVPLLWGGLAYGALGGGELPLEDRVLSALGAYVVMSALATGFRLLRGVDGLGGGDIKLLTAFATWLPPPMLAQAILLGSLVQMTWMLATRRKCAAFGPALCLAAMVEVVWAWRV